MADNNQNEPDLKALARELLAVNNWFKGSAPTEIDFKTLKELLDKAKGIDLKALWDQVEKQRAAHDQLIKMISTRRHGAYVAGLDEERHKFSMIRAVHAIHRGSWDDAGFEKEVFEQTRKNIKHVIGVESEGGFFVSDQVIPDVIAQIYARSVLIALDGAEGTTRVSVVDGLTGASVRVPKFNGGMLAYWLGEKDGYIDSAASVGTKSMTPKKLTLLTRLSEEMRRWGGFGFESLLRNDMSRAAALEVDRVGVYGRGIDNEPRGVIHTQNIRRYSAASNAIVATADSATTVTAGGELNFDVLDEIAGTLEDENIPPNESFAHISAPRLFRRLKRTKVDSFSGQTENQMYLVGVPSISDAKLAELIGNFDKTTQIGTTKAAGASCGWTATDDAAEARHTDLVSGNWSEMLLGRWGVMEIVDDQGRGPGFLRDEVYMKARMYLDTMIRQEKAFTVTPDVIARDL